MDWSDEQQVAAAGNGQVIKAIDTIVQAGEVLYVPAYWFHFIVSMEYSFQCNTRSGSPESNIGRKEIQACSPEMDI